MRLMFVLLCAFLFGPTATSAAQSGVQVGSAAGAFSTGVSLARDADAVFWNPALIGIQPFGDVRVAPTGGLRLFSVALSSPSREWIDGAAAVGVIGGRAGAPAPWWSGIGSMTPEGGLGGAADIVWASSASSTMSAAVSTHVNASGHVAQVEAGDSVRRSAATVAILSLAGPVGHLGGVRARLGITLKGRWVHSHAIGTWSDSAAAGGAMFRETRLDNVPGGSADLGFVVQPGAVVISAAVSDIVRVTARPRGGAVARTVVRNSGAGGMREDRSPVDGSDDRFLRESADHLYQATVPPAVLRLGASWASKWGEPAAAVERRLRAGGLGTVPESSWAVSYLAGERLPPLRLGIAGGGGTGGFQLAWIARSCRAPWSVSAGRHRRSADDASAVVVSLSLGARSSRACGRPE